MGFCLDYPPCSPALNRSAPRRPSWLLSLGSTRLRARSSGTPRQLRLSPDQTRVLQGVYLSSDRRPLLDSSKGTFALVTGHCERTFYYERSCSYQGLGGSQKLVSGSNLFSAICYHGWLLGLTVDFRFVTPLRH